MGATAGSWPPGDGEMAGRIRAIDWSATPLGPVAAWPDRLRAYVDLLLDSRAMMCLLWGPEATQLYNDAYAAGIGARHPAALGHSAFVNFADVRETFEPLFLRAWDGESVTVHDRHFDFDPGMSRPEGWFDLTYTPLRDAAGKTAGVLAILAETTDRVQAAAALRESEARYRMLFESMDQGFGVAEILPDDSGRPPDYRMLEINPQFERLTGQPREAFLDGKTVRQTAPELEEEWFEFYGSVGVTGVPARREIYAEAWARWFEVAAYRTGAPEQRRVAILYWDITQRKQAETALRESEERYRTLFETMGQGYCDLELIRDDTGRAVDQRYLELNPAFERIFGIPVTHAQGRRASEVFPDLEPWWHDTFDRIAKQGQPDRIEYEMAALGRWYEVFAYPRGGDRLTVLYEDVTERRRAQDALHESEERQAFLLRLTDALRPIADPIAVQDTAARLLGEHLRTDRTYYVEFDLQHQVAVIHRDYVRGDAPSLIGTHAFEQFDFFASVHELGRGIPLVVDDVATAPGTRAAVAAYESVAVRAYIIVPLLRAGALVAGITVTQMEPRRWSADELSLLQEVAERTWAAVERARTEAALQESERRYRTLFESIDEGYGLYELLFDDAGEPFDVLIHQVNPAYETLTQRPGAAGRRLSEFSSGWDPAWGDAMAEVVRSGQPRRIERFNKDIARWFDVYLHPDPESGPARFGIVLSDITERRAMVDALQFSEERFRAFAENATDTLWIVDTATGQLEYLSPAFERTWGEPRAGVLGDLAHWAELVHPEDRTWASQAIQRVLAGEAASLVSEYRIVRQSDGAIRWIYDTGFAIHDGAGAIRRIAGIAQDVTSRKAAEAALWESEARYREALEAEVAAATVELRTLSRRLLTVQEEERRYLARELHDEIGQVLTGLGMTLGAGEMLQSTQLVQARRIVAELVEQVRELSVHLRPTVLDDFGLLVAVHWLRERLDQRGQLQIVVHDTGLDRRFESEIEIAAFRIIQEALTNVMRHANARTASVLLVTDAQHLTIEIEDDGTGFDSATVADGTGLGGMRERAELLGGTLTVRAQPGNGVTVTADLPLTDRADGVTEQAKRAVSRQ